MSVVVHAHPHEAFRNYNVLGAGFDWTLKTWNERDLWGPMAQSKAGWAAGASIVVIVGK